MNHLYLQRIQAGKALLQNPLPPLADEGRSTPLFYKFIVQQKYIVVYILYIYVYFMFNTLPGKHKSLRHLDSHFKGRRIYREIERSPEVSKKNRIPPKKIAVLYKSQTKLQAAGTTF
jgi:hypothetical protein